MYTISKLIVLLVISKFVHVMGLPIRLVEKGDTTPVLEGSGSNNTTNECTCDDIDPGVLAAVIVGGIIFILIACIGCNVCCVVYFRSYFKHL